MRGLALALLLLVSPRFDPTTIATDQGSCTYWLAPSGSDGGNGSRSHPWATLDHATSVMPDEGCTLILSDGSYSGGQEIERRFRRHVTIRAETAYRARLVHEDTVLHLDGASNVTIEGLEITHSGPGSTGYLVLVDARNGVGSTGISLSNNVIHDSFDNDLLKVHNHSTGTRIIGNLFYNQGPREQQIDINGAERTSVAGNVFFNDYVASGRSVVSDAKHFIVVKDSNEGADGVLGSRETTIRNNVFAHWQGGAGETFIKIGNDGKPYHEAVGVDIFNNLILGDSALKAGAALGVSGAREVAFVNNTVVGDLPSSAYAMRINTKGSNPDNEDLLFANNIWSDPTGTMGSANGTTSLDFSAGDPGTVRDLVLVNNLYWNGPREVPGGDVADGTHDDAQAIFANPGLPPGLATRPLPTWNGSMFADGSSSAAEAWQRLIDGHAKLPSGAAPVDQADPAFAPATDIRGRPRGATPAVGAWDPGYQRAHVGIKGSTLQCDIRWLALVRFGCHPTGSDSPIPDP